MKIFIIKQRGGCLILIEKLENSRMHRQKRKLLCRREMLLCKGGCTFYDKLISVEYIYTHF